MIITLTTDFGLVDGFVGTMKGVILGIQPDVHLVDLSHDVGSYDILQGALILNSAWRYFPDGTIHVVVVDPGVGSSRRPIAVAAGKQIFVAPDNGVLSFILEDPALNPATYHIADRGLFLAPVSQTFHGRDIFAPVAARLAARLPIETLGPSVTDPVRLKLPVPRRHSENCVIGAVLRVDKFGNIMTNLKSKDIEENWSINAGGRTIRRILSSYSEAQSDELFAIEGSAGFMEIAMKQQSAAATLNIGEGAEVRVQKSALGPAR